MDFVLVSLLSFLQLKSVVDRFRLTQDSSQSDLRLLDIMESVFEVFAIESVMPKSKRLN